MSGRPMHKLAGEVAAKRASGQERKTLKPAGSKGDLSKTGKKKSSGLFARLEDLYRRMEAGYRECAETAGLTCADCETNCCTSFFRHHTYVEWAYLWRGLAGLPEEKRRRFAERAGEYLEEAGRSLAVNALPTAMCPLNENGLCVLYPYRLMICRLHGTRNSFTLPDGRQQFFPGCARFTSLPCARAATTGPEETEAPTCPTLDRTPFYAELAALEAEFLRRAGRPLPRVNMTLAEMIVSGPPKIR